MPPAVAALSLCVGEACQERADANGYGGPEFDSSNHRTVPYGNFIRRDGSSAQGRGGMDDQASAADVAWLIATGGVDGRAISFRLLSR